MLSIYFCFIHSADGGTLISYIGKTLRSYNRRMNDPAARPAESSIPRENALLFAAEDSHGNRPGASPERSWLPWIVAAVVILLIVVLAFVFGGRRAANRVASGVDPYAAQLAISSVQLSQATNFAGDQLTYVDGTIMNHGDRTVTGITVRVLFANDDGEQPQTEQVPLNLIRTRQPYVDTEPVSGAPLKPGTSADFRLIFDDVSSLWNQQIPVVKIQSLTTVAP